MLTFSTYRFFKSNASSGASKSRIQYSNLVIESKGAAHTQSSLTIIEVELFPDQIWIGDLGRSAKPRFRHSDRITFLNGYHSALHPDLNPDLNPE
jgi:hypothetical protein